MHPDYTGGKHRYCCRFQEVLEESKYGHGAQDATLQWKLALIVLAAGGGSSYPWSEIQLWQMKLGIITLGRAFDILG